MNIYKQRYLNALKKAARINRYLKKGYHVFCNGHPQEHGFFMRDGWLLLKDNEHCSTIYFYNHKDWDHGLYTKIADYNRDFNETFSVYAPSARISL